MLIVLLELNFNPCMASYSWGGGGKDEEWFIVRIIFSSETSGTYFLGVEAFLEVLKYGNLLRWPAAISGNGGALF